MQPQAGLACLVPTVPRVSGCSTGSAQALPAAAACRQQPEDAAHLLARHELLLQFVPVLKGHAVLLDLVGQQRPLGVEALLHTPSACRSAPGPTQGTQPGWAAQAVLLLSQPVHRLACSMQCCQASAQAVQRSSARGAAGDRGGGGAADLEALLLRLVQARLRCAGQAAGGLAGSHAGQEARHIRQ